jgi:hypothetical protein
MRRIDGELVFSPTDLVTYFQSPFASWMDRALFEDQSWSSRRDPEDALMTSLSKRGSIHEASFNSSLEEDGRRVVEIARDDVSSMFLATMSAMRAPQGRTRRDRSTS